MYNLSRDYEKLFELICVGKIAVGFVDYKRLDLGTRDVCQITREKENLIMIYVRGTGYGSIYPSDLDNNEERTEKELFINLCKYCNLEFIMPTESEA